VHDPANVEAATEARRLGGLRRRREGTLAGAYVFEGLTSIDQIRRLVEIAVLDVLGLDNSIGRARTLLAAAREATHLLEVGELEERVRLLELAVLHQRPERRVPLSQSRMRRCSAVKEVQHERTESLATRLAPVVARADIGG
jgi:hypothetical protein